MHYLQGFLNTLVYGFTNRNYRELLLPHFWLKTVFNILISPLVIWPKAIVYITYKFKSICKKEEKNMIDYTTGEDSSAKSDKNTTLFNTEITDLYPEMVNEINVVQNKT